MDILNAISQDYYLNFLIRNKPRIFFYLIKIRLYLSIGNVLYRNKIVNSYKQYQILSKTNIEINNDLIYDSTADNLPQVVEYMLKYLSSDDINNDIIHSDNLTLPIIKILIKNNINNAEFLHQAIAKGDIAMLNFLLQNGYSLNTTFQYNNEQTTLASAVYNQKYTMAKYLLAYIYQNNIIYEQYEDLLFELLNSPINDQIKDLIKLFITIVNPDPSIGLNMLINKIASNDIDINDYIDIITYFLNKMDDIQAIKIISEIVYDDMKPADYFVDIINRIIEKYTYDQLIPYINNIINNFVYSENITMLNKLIDYMPKSYHDYNYEEALSLAFVQKEYLLYKKILTNLLLYTNEINNIYLEAIQDELEIINDPELTNLFNSKINSK